MNGSQRLAQLHRSSGAFLGVFLFVILFSGSWSLGSDALKLWWNKAPLSGVFLPLEQLIALQPNASLIQLPQPTYPVMTFCQGMGNCEHSYSAISGQAIEQNTPTQWIVTLHKNMFIDFSGRIVVSLFGFALAILLITGVMIHRRRIATMMRFPRRTHLRGFLHDLHLWLGLWSYPWLLLFAFTGALSGLGALGTLTLADKVSPDNPQAVMKALMGDFRSMNLSIKPIFNASPDTLIASLQKVEPEFIPQTLMLQGNQWTIGGVRIGQPATANFEQYQFDITKGQFVGSRNSADQALWTRAFIAIQPLHYGQYQWLSGAQSSLSILHFIAGLSACFLVASGLAMWCVRQKNTIAARWIIGSCGGLLLAASLLLASMPFSLSFLRPMHFFGLWSGLLVMIMLMRNTHLSLFIVGLLSAIALFFAFCSSLWFSGAMISRVDLSLCFCSVMLFIAVLLGRKLLGAQWRARS